MRPHVSPSQISMADRCEVAWFRRYMLGEKVPPGIAIYKGIGPHVAAEVNNRQKIESHVDLSVETLQEAAMAGIENKLATEGLELTSDEKSQGVENVIGQVKDKVAYTLVPLYHAAVAPLIQPELVEQEVRIELPYHSHDLLGIIDVATTDRVVRDLKVSAKSKSQGEADTSIQLSFYAMAYRWIKGEYPSGVGLDVLVDLKKKPKTQWLPTTRDDTDTEYLLNRVNITLDRINRIASGEIEPKPAPIGHPLCSERFCGYATTCRFYNSTRKAAAEENEEG